MNKYCSLDVPWFHLEKKMQILLYILFLWGQSEKPHMVSLLLSFILHSSEKLRIYLRPLVCTNLSLTTSDSRCSQNTVLQIGSHIGSLCFLSKPSLSHFMLNHFPLRLPSINCLPLSCLFISFHFGIFILCLRQFPLSRCSYSDS